MSLPLFAILVVKLEYRTQNPGSKSKDKRKRDWVPNRRKTGTVDTGVQLRTYELNFRAWAQLQAHTNRLVNQQLATFSTVNVNLCLIKKWSQI